MDDGLPFVIHSATRITLKPEARFWAQEHGLSLEEFARYLLNREKVREDNGES
jgi:hypothetical protein